MRPIGFQKIYKERNSLDKMPKKSIKKWKRGEKHKIKMQIRKELNYDIMDDIDKEYYIRIELEENDRK
jgi:hypothetical protein